ncbi:cyclase family protein [Daejeonella sp.]|uniref:cyclase family protein n=1 Tax=Daejeonella sp. TaxID=2805397 RepID=UPI002C26DEAA|nr:cyclase family protein [Daejeonella sp.]HQT24931.1 cyclase family protein [Daejeonella sp.]HQT58847.1 cyclase family protein [Daejeonella sp.]
MPKSEFVSLSYFFREDTPLYGGGEGNIIFKQTNSINNGQNSNNLHVSFPNHAGTHVDFPYHFDNSGKKSHEYDAAFWVFKKVGFIECDVDKVEEAIVDLPEDIELLILKTGFGAKRSSKEYWSSQPIIPAKLASIFRKKFSHLRAFGFDLISLTSKLNREEGKAAHLAFLIEHGILIVEDMNLQEVSSAPASVIVSPFQIYAADGAPCNITAFY